ncbi:hypothetical protein ACPPVO_44155 [Dactylosporangium sp. McL0621]|uniref:hypothetical protein n=1 Tax=Dactylosporangium sp. McL0621 TaxID=3415678 RepID=UPI003CEBF241
MVTDSAALFEGLHPDELALHHWVRTRVNGGAVREMARLDYGMRVEAEMYPPRTARRSAATRPGSRFRGGGRRDMRTGP